MTTHTHVAMPTYTVVYYKKKGKKLDLGQSCDIFARSKKLQLHDTFL